MCFNLIEPITYWNVIFFLKKLLVLGAALFEYLQTKRMVSKYHIKICGKITKKKSNPALKSWTEPLLNRTKPMKFLYVQKLKFWIILYDEECRYGYKVCIKKFLHVENYYKLQYRILRLFSSHVEKLHGNNYNIFLNITCLLSDLELILLKSQINININISKSQTKPRLICYNLSAKNWLIWRVSSDHQFSTQNLVFKT